MDAASQCPDSAHCFPTTDLLLYSYSGSHAWVLPDQSDTARDKHIQAASWLILSVRSKSSINQCSGMSQYSALYTMQLKQIQAICCWQSAVADVRASDTFGTLISQHTTAKHTATSRGILVCSVACMQPDSVEAQGEELSDNRS